jgi:hypothetical protein
MRFAHAEVEPMTELTFNKQFESIPDWRSEHDEAMKVLDLEAGAKIFIGCMRLLEKTEQHYRRLMFREEMPVETAMAHFAWINNARRVGIEYTSEMLPELKKFAKSYEIEDLDTLILWDRKIRDILTPDDDFFGEELGGLAEAAVAENQAGQTENYE